MGNDTDYASEMGQAVHRPGMAGVVNRGEDVSHDPRDQSGNRLGPRRTAGPADPATRKQFLKTALQTSSEAARTPDSPSPRYASMTKDNRPPYAPIAKDNTPLPEPKMPLAAPGQGATGIMGAEREKAIDREVNGATGST